MSIGYLRDCAAGHVARYTGADGNRAFRTYDCQGDPSVLTPLDCLAPALLSGGGAGELEGQGDGQGAVVAVVQLRGSDVVLRSEMTYRCRDCAETPILSARPIGRRALLR